MDIYHALSEEASLQSQAAGLDNTADLGMSQAL